MPAEDPPLLFGRFQGTVSRPELRKAALRLRREVADGRPYFCLLTDDGELQRLNREFLKQDYPTDVLSFPAEEGSWELGQMAISVDRAREQAAAFGHTIEEEIQILMLHGLLHLLGMDHEKDGGQMARAEAGWRRKLGLPSGLIERVRR